MTRHKTATKHKNRHKTAVYFTLLYTKPEVETNSFPNGTNRLYPLWH